MGMISALCGQVLLRACTQDRYSVQEAVYHYCATSSSSARVSNPAVALDHLNCFQTHAYGPGLFLPSLCLSLEDHVPTLDSESKGSWSALTTQCDTTLCL